MSTILKWLTAAGKTPAGKAAEHALVTAASAGIAAAFSTLTAGGDAKAAVFAFGTVFLVGVRAYVKAVVRGLPTESS